MRVCERAPRTCRCARWYAPGACPGCIWVPGRNRKLVEERWNNDRNLSIISPSLKLLGYVPTAALQKGTVLPDEHLHEVLQS